MTIPLGQRLYLLIMGMLMIMLALWCASTSNANMRAFWQEIDAVFHPATIHATIAKQAHTQPTLTPKPRPAWSQHAEIKIIAIVGLAILIASLFLSPFVISLCAIIGILILMVINSFLWLNFQWILSISTLLTLIVLLTAHNALYLFFSRRRSLQLETTFKSYVPAAHVKKITRQPQDEWLQGSHRELTVMFADIHHFNDISKQLDANQVRYLLNQYFTPMTEIILDCGGTIDKYVGELIMAFWGAPIKDENHRQHACEAALRMRAQIQQLAKHFSTQLGIKDFNMGIGINTGMMNVGDMGSNFRRSYTVLGDAVNLGSQLEDLTEFYQVDIITGNHELNKNMDYIFRKLDRIQLNPAMSAFDIFQLMARKDEITTALSNEILQHDRAMSLYYARQWQAAKNIFSDLQLDYPDSRIYPIMLQRINHYQEHPPPASWDGTELMADTQFNLAVANLSR